ncbi:MAG TPA: dihydroneopterin aldolase [Dehalococcoidia bacterium]|nr:dihydroneopterin aldolase [Dehalococcoidia bacterium]
MNQDQISLTKIEFYGYHGVHPEENILGQRFSVDLTVTHDLSSAGQTDDINKTISYSLLYKLTKQIIEGAPHKLLESVAESVAQAILSNTPANSITIKLSKMHPPIKGAKLESASIQISRTAKNVS